MRKWLYFTFAMILISLAGCGETATPIHQDMNKNVDPTPTSETASKEEAATDFKDQNSDGEFLIYLVQQGVSPEEMTEINLNELLLEDRPIISIDDITAYTWDTHEIELTKFAYARLARLQTKALHYPWSLFVVCVGSERIYQGAIWSSYSSATYDGIVIDIYPAEKSNPIRIQTGYPSPEWFQGEDLRNDPRIYISLKDSNKLR